MFNLIKTISVAVALPAVLALSAGCSSESGGAGGGATTEGSGGKTTTTTGATGGSAGTGTCPQYTDPAGTDLTTPVVTFKADVVVKVFNVNCGSSACHGAKTMAAPTVFLGDSTKNGSDAAEVYAAIVGPKGDELPSMPFVTPDMPTESYLMHKLDGDQCQYASECATSSYGSCGADMPSGLGTLLGVSTRDVVRRWIAQGAKND